LARYCRPDYVAKRVLQDQVEQGQVLFIRLAEEERRIFAFALRLVERMREMGANHHRGTALLPELLKVAGASIGSK
jgi:hypothetical protein